MLQHLDIVVTFANTVNKKRKMSVSQRKLRQQQELKNQIIDCSRIIVNEEGWSALSIRRIADAIEYSVPVIYKHFENKEAITSFFVNEGFELLLLKIQTHINSAKTASEKLHALAKGYHEFALTHPKHYEVMFGIGIPTCEHAQSNETIKNLSELFRRLIAELVQESGKDTIDQLLKFKTLWSILHGVIAFELLALDKKNEKCPGLILEDAVDGFITSILK
ncbi:TetR/AcrR family transcriptional regulator [Sphingobacterium sp. HJSM2_6]|uniref:TetR/AcrR family transcriptional regulator n=1 Tax=Sphingobacterium sp. HJSM2_6 TaxID=3366264 RepID=UPI003BDA9BE3